MSSQNPYQWVEEYETKLADLKQKSNQLNEILAATTATASSKDGAVRVTVGPNGGLQNLQLGHRSVELGAPRLTALILETARRAQKQAAQEVLEVFAPLGEGTEAYQMVSDSIPADEPESGNSFAELEQVEEQVSVALPHKGAPQPPQVRGRHRTDGEEDDNQPW